MVDRFHPRLYVACSFQKETSVIMDMLVRIEPNARFFTLDTGVLFSETYATWTQLEQRYRLRVDSYQGMPLERQTAVYGERLWKRSPEACCGIRKIAPLGHALAKVDAWVTGLRREQSCSRARAGKVHWDGAHGIWKANPLADWSERDVYRYLAQHDVPYNELHDRGYGSVGCTHCTRPGTGREGRWSGSDRTECGIHA
jgi:phosphoadenosine phosphosulfate reductase